MTDKRTLRTSCFLPLMAAVALAGGWSPVEAQTATRLEGQATAKQAPQTRRVSRPSGDVRKPRFRVDDETGALVPDLRAEAAIIYDVQTGEIIWGENIEVQRSIASITKVMTAVVFLDWNPDLSQDVLVTRADVRNASTTYLLPGERVQVYDLLHLLLIPSDNAAARVIARMYPGGEPAFVDRMNQKAEQLGLQSTTYADPSGLSSANVSSAYDMARLITYAVSNERIGSIMRTSQYTLRTSRRREVTVRTTNQLVRQGDVDVVGGKTGFIRKAGYCLAALLRLPEGGPEVAVVVLGAQTSLTRFWEARHLLNWFSQNAKSLFAGVPDAHSE